MRSTFKFLNQWPFTTFLENSLNSEFSVPDSSSDMGVAHHADGIPVGGTPSLVRCHERSPYAVARGCVGVLRGRYPRRGDPDPRCRQVRTVSLGIYRGT